VKVLFVCSGNICRSPMAAEYLRHRAAHEGLAHVVVDSAGTLGIVGAPASHEAVCTLREVGLDLSSHRSKGVGEPDVRSSDLIIGMARDHLDYLTAAYPERSGQRLLLRAFETGARPSTEAPDLADPIGAAVEVYRKQFGIMRTCIDHLVLYLRHLEPEGDRD
jgi:protein-tyrosine-phosphatase